MFVAVAVLADCVFFPTLTPAVSVPLSGSESPEVGSWHGAAVAL